jgi:hypothetical protein
MDQDPSNNRDLTHRIIGLAMRVHRRLGPGLLINFNTVSLTDGTKRCVL